MVAESKLVRAARMFFRLSAIPLAAVIQARWVRKYGDLPLRHQPVFIIGAPRTGSTVLYQALTNAFDVLYVDNLACRWHQVFPFGMWLSRKRFGDKPHHNFEAVHGSTAAFGAHAPSECGAFWYRWLSRTRHFIDHDEVGRTAIERIRLEITAVINRFDRPILFKNMNAGQRLRLLVACFPDAKFIYIRRDRADVVESIMRVREVTGTKPGELWSIRPQGYEELLGMPEREMVVAQVAAIEAQIDTDLQMFPSENIAVVRFEDLSHPVIQRLGHFIGASPKAGGSLPEFGKKSPNAQHGASIGA